ncbi:hypothetical protein [Thalassoglobus polymorphus]|uniref:Uncharacterized protein n=1 Tax=Thalassoglobus polymorphus TaxID=2527994 RepID=A0A517QRI2_9PLAN|nr:hypothetical protein [Thalassoglobus polymorphus]QDT34244.1 hypothetical protein Mal48_35040 [Thalassoglobus polymorphus]
MTRLPQSARFIASIALVLGLHVVATQAVEAGRPLTKTKFDPNAKQVELFAGMESGEIKAKPIAKDALSGKLLLTNETDEPISVKMPQGFIVSPLAQFGGGGGGYGGGGQGGGQGGGGQQQGGGGTGGQQGGQQGGGGGGFFSIPAKKTLSVPYVSVCLEYGKIDPHPRSEYIVRPSTKFSDDPVLLTLIDMVGTGKLNPAAAQAAAWHLSSGMSWQELASLKYDRVGTPDTPYFSRAQLMAAQQVVATAQHIAKEGGLNKEEKPLDRVNPRERAAR